jgi:hypothetical protein
MDAMPQADPVLRRFRAALAEIYGERIRVEHLAECP